MKKGARLITPAEAAWRLPSPPLGDLVGRLSGKYGVPDTFRRQARRQYMPGDFAAVSGLQVNTKRNDKEE